jgi:hypothetical protein
VGASSVKNLVGTVVSAGVLPDLVLVAAIFALAIVPLAQFGRTRPQRAVLPEPSRALAGAQA